MTYTITPPEYLALRVEEASQFQGRKPEELIVAELERMFGKEPRTLEDEAAMVLLRAEAMKQAVALGEPGESEWNTASRAGRIMAFLAEGRQ